MNGSNSGRNSRLLFVLTILTGSFLLFLVQPMVARMALPRLGGAPNVWNSAMLVYQALLLGGYAYAHWLGRFSLRRQAAVQIGLLLVATITLPIVLVPLSPPAPGWEALWVPLLLGLSVGPVFFLVSAQAPLMQRWFAADPAAGEPWALYAASNLGSFAGLIAYPLAAEPMLSIHEQSWAWSAGYAVLIGLVALAAWSRWQAPGLQAATGPASMAAAPPIANVPRRTLALWLALSAVPSGLMLSTTTHLTTDIFAMPLLWVIPLGVYLLSFVFAFSERRGVTRVMSLVAPLVLILAGGLAMVSRGSGGLSSVAASVLLLFVVCVVLHGRMYDTRPDPSQLTLFYFVMSAGGALGGFFTALIAPLVFDWAWEHPLLVVASAVLMPVPRWLDWRWLPGLGSDMARFAALAIFACAVLVSWLLAQDAMTVKPGSGYTWLTAGIAVLALALVPWRHMFAGVLVLTMLAQGGLATIYTSLQGARSRSYFGIYTVRDYPADRMRTLAHGTTMHGQQSLDPNKRRNPLTYYGPGSGVGIAFANAQKLFGPYARIGVVGLGTGTLACYHAPGEDWRFFEIDPVVLAYSRNRTFTYLSDCAPNAQVVIGDARLSLQNLPRGSLDLLAVDAFSSDSIPLHLLTGEAFDVYLDSMSPKGVLLVHISNRFIELEPVLAAEARKRGLAAMIRNDYPSQKDGRTPSSWVLLSRDPGQLAALGKLVPATPLTPLTKPAPLAWTDDHASILPYIRWDTLLGRK